MSGILKLIGDVSGYAQITSNSTANNTTFYLPQNSGTFITGNTSSTPISSNLTIASTAGIVANGSIGTAGQVLTSNASGMYWSSPTSTSAPAFSAYLTTTNQTISLGTFTKVTLNAEEFDTNNNFDSTTNYRFTPTVAGYYLITWGMTGSATGAVTSVIASIYKNGTEYKRGSYVSASNYSSASSTGSAIVYFNGSTDYIELYGWISGTGTPVVVYGIFNTYLTGVLVRTP